MSEAVAVIVVNYNTAALSIAAVESVRCRRNDGYDVTVYLVDNASPAGDAEVLLDAHRTRHWGDSVQLICETENHGFGRGNNVVLHALRDADTPPSKVMLLNPDARLENEVVSQLANTLNQTPKAAAVGASVFRSDMTRVSAAFRFPTAQSEFARMLRLGIVDKLLAAHLVPLSPDHSGGEVDWVSGAAVMFRFDALAEVGFFDPAFFLYYEEVDLMRRLTQEGWCVIYEPKAHVIHEEGAATGQFGGAAGRKRNPAYLYDSWVHYFKSAYGRRGAIAIALLNFIAGCGNVFHRRIRLKEPGIPLYFFRDQWFRVLRPLLKR